jgi:restriction system protein
MSGHACRAAQEQADALHRAYQQQAAQHAAAAKERVEALGAARAAYEQQCREREAAAAERNADLDQLINELAFDVESAIEEYVGIVLSNSAYPDCFPVAHEHHFDLSTRELALTVRIPPPSQIPTRRHPRPSGRGRVTQTGRPRPGRQRPWRAREPAAVTGAVQPTAGLANTPARLETAHRLET